MGNNLNSFQPMKEFQSQDTPLKDKRITLDINEDEIFSRILDISNTLLFEYNTEFLKEDFCSKLAIIYSKKLSKFNLKVLKSLYNSINSKDVEEDFTFAIQYLPKNEDKFTDFMDIFKDGLKESFWNKKIELDPEKLSLNDNNLQKNNITSYLKKNQTQYYINPKHVNNLLNNVADPIVKIGGFVKSNTNLIKKFNAEPQKNSRNKNISRIINSKEKIYSGKNNNNSEFNGNREYNTNHNFSMNLTKNTVLKSNNTESNTQNRRESNTQNRRESNTQNRMESNTQNRRESNTQNRMESNTQNRMESNTQNRMESNTQNRMESNTQNRKEPNIPQNESSNFKHISIKKLNEKTNNIILKNYSPKEEGETEIAVNNLIKYYCPKDFTPKSFCDNSEKCQLTKKELCIAITQNFMVRNNIIAAILTTIPYKNKDNVYEGGLCYQKFLNLINCKICVPHDYPNLKNKDINEVIKQILEKADNLDEDKCIANKGFFLKLSDKEKIILIRKARELSGDINDVNSKVKYNIFFEEFTQKLKNTYFNNLNNLITILEKIQTLPLITNKTLNIISIDTKNIIDNMYNLCHYYYVYGIISLINSDITEEIIKEDKLQSFVSKALVK